MDEESELFILSLYCCASQLYFVTALAKREAFIKARGRHYSNEAEAMKVCIENCSPWPLFLTAHNWIFSSESSEAHGPRG